MTIDLDILGRKTIKATTESIRREIRAQHDEWIARQARFQQLEIEAERTHWSADRLIRYRDMGYSPHRLAEMSGDSILVVMDVLRSMRRRAK